MICCTILNESYSLGLFRDSFGKIGTQKDIIESELTEKFLMCVVHPWLGCCDGEAGYWVPRDGKLQFP